VVSGGSNRGLVESAAQEGREKAVHRADLEGAWKALPARRPHLDDFSYLPQLVLEALLPICHRVELKAVEEVDLAKGDRISVALMH
jgi:hypothetical protein